mmetsp:Transcript_1884/g.6725  ORF Transcript_1884/g.6725 Transcript_1884/m.6725 type:complete len:112 (+) Transcript_1884:107-442(+)
MDKVLPSTTDDDQPLVEAGYHYEDRFFDDVEGIVAVFDFDYEKIIAFDWDVAVASWVTAPCFFPLLALFCEEPRPDCTAGWSRDAGPLRDRRAVARRGMSKCAVRCVDADT